jgi:hypothetical protein
MDVCEAIVNVDVSSLHTASDILTQLSQYKNRTDLWGKDLKNGS